MLWIKRNLFLATGGLIALVLLGVGVFFFLGAKSRSAALQDEINQAKATLEQHFRASVFPSPTNIAIANAESEKLRAVLGDMKRFFAPVRAENVTGLAFRSWRDNTLAELRERARQARTTLPTAQYAFSFEAQKNKVDFQEGTFPAIPQQMAEVKALCHILFEAHVDPLVNIRRARVSKDDENSPVATDYLTHKIQTNTLTGTVTTPYELTFHCLSSELAVALQGFVSSPHGFVVKAIHVEPAAEPSGPPGGPGPNPPQPGTPKQGLLPGAALPAAGTAPGRVSGAAPKPGSAGGSVVLLKERRLKVTMLVHTIKAVK